ncbi:hypothetical protein [Spiroplasma endosymbiont of Nebria brevicollis]|uniref:hypothetical protein n=1 Tax=Spiroplasma endosymbiont of Nebria brevicollis TaxID=3066284 RepID=UPI00313E14D1
MKIKNRIFSGTAPVNGSIFENCEFSDNASANFIDCKYFGSFKEKNQMIMIISLKLVIIATPINIKIVMKLLIQISAYPARIYLEDMIGITINTKYYQMYIWK